MTNPDIRTDRAARTHARIVEAAHLLFAEHGYDNVTVGRIATEVGISEMTFFRHFPTKESLVVDDPYDPLMALHVARQPQDAPLMTRVAGGIRAAWRAVPEPDAAIVRSRLRIAAASPALRAATRQANEASARAVAESLVTGGAVDVEARIAAEAAFAGLTEALLSWAEHDELELGEVLEQALCVLEGSR